MLYFKSKAYEEFAAFDALVTKISIEYTRRANADVLARDDVFRQLTQDLDILSEFKAYKMRQTMSDNEIRDFHAERFARSEELYLEFQNFRQDKLNNAKRPENSNDEARTELEI